MVPRVDLQEYKDNLTEIIRLSKENRIKVCLLTRPFIGPSPHEWWWKNFAPAYNAVTKEIAQSNDVPVIDIYSAFEDKKDYFIDESHFNRSGYRLAARMICEGIMSLLYGSSAGPHHDACAEPG